MWLVRLRMRKARPWARGRNRFMVGPSSTYASAALSAFTRAFAMALCSTLRTGSLAACGANCNTAMASVACLPRIRSTTRRAFMGVTRTCRACALASIAVPCFRSKIGSGGWLTRVADHRSAAASFLVVLHVTLERPGRRKLTELVANHGLGHEHRDVLAAVVYGDRVSEHVGHDHRTTRPGLDDVLGARIVLDIHLLLKVVVDEGALLQATRHF